MRDATGAPHLHPHQDRDPERHPNPQFRRESPYNSMITTRRLRARPSLVPLSAAGSDSPAPRMVIRDASMPRPCRYFMTVVARRSESDRLYASVPMLSVWPTISTRAPGLALRYLTAASSVSFPTCLRLLLSKSKYTPVMRKTSRGFGAGGGAGAGSTFGAGGGGGGGAGAGAGAAAGG